MRKIIWDPSFSVGVDELDGHHQHLGVLINRLAEHIRSPGDGGAVGDILIELADYAIYHFRHEELMMARHGFPQLASHRAEHLQFCEMVAELSYGATLGIVDLSQLFAFLTRWWACHILQEDMKYKPFLTVEPVS